MPRPAYSSYFFSLACIIIFRQLLNHKNASVRLEPKLVHDRSQLSLPLKQLLVVGRISQIIHLIFFLACIIKIQPHRVHDSSLLSLALDHMLVVAHLAQLIHLNLFFLASVINMRHISSHKMSSVGLELHLVHDTSLLSLPLDHLPVFGCLAQLIHLIFFL